LRIHGDQTTAIDGVLRTRPDGPLDWEVMHALELGRGRGALDLASRGRSLIDPGELQRLVRRRLEATVASEIERVAAELDELRVRADSASSRAEVPTAQELRWFAKKHGNGTVLSWWLGQEQAWLLVVRGSVVRKFELGSSTDCRRQVAAAWRAIATPNGDVAALAVAAEVLLPIAARQHFTDVVLAIVDPTMARLPLAALLVDGEPFGVRYALVQAPSLAVASLLDQRRGTGEGRIIVEAPRDTPLTQRLHLDPLVFAQRECDAVQAAHGEAARLRGEAAIFADRAAASPDLLHIAAHAIDCPDLPTQSLLLLADGPHAMGSLGGLELPGTFVVLSACSAATGEQRGHEGVVGLVEGMFAAGARAVVAPVAAVNQQATADFMKVFHTALAAGLEPAFALQQARRTLAAADNYAHPHYWGTFALFGGIPDAAHPLAEPRPWITPTWMLVGGLLVLGLIFLLPRQQRRVGLR